VLRPSTVLKRKGAAFAAPYSGVNPAYHGGGFVVAMAGHKTNAARAERFRVRRLRSPFSAPSAGRLTRSFLKDALGPHALAAALPTSQTFYE